MNRNRTFTFAPAGSTSYYQWQPRIFVECGYSRPKVYHPTEASYRRFVRLANSGLYRLTIDEQESVAWQLSRKAA